MARFDSARFYPATAEGGQIDIWSSPARNLRFNVPYDQEVVVSESDEANLPGLAHRLLGDMDLWWVLLEYNGLHDPIRDIVSGVRLRVPQRKALISYLERNPSPAASQVTL